MIKLDYTLESPEERKALVEKIIAETPDITPAYLEILGNYLVLCMEKQERKERNRPCQLVRERRRWYL